MTEPKAGHTVGITAQEVVYSRVQVIRHRVGMTSIQAILWNVGGSAVCIQLSVGVAHSSVEASVTEVERRGGHVREEECINGLGRRSACNLSSPFGVWT